jgi:hypothetical protein
MRRLSPLAWNAAGILALTALTWFEFPGHTWLQQDTQIYVAILEHLRDPSVLRRDLLATRPHVSFTLYDETARGFARLTGLGFREVLEGQQFVTRALGIWGLFLMAGALGLSAPASLLVAGIVSLGATIAGPAVLSFEIEPDPRGFAVPLLFLAIGLAAHKRYFAAGTAASVAFLMHPPTVVPFWAVYVLLFAALWGRRLRLQGVSRPLAAFIPLSLACILLAISAHFQQGASERQVFFSRISPAVENLQRLRAPYSWISEWWRDGLPYYCVLYAVSVLAYTRLRKTATRNLRLFLIGLPLLGILSVPFSYVFLEKLNWVLLPQLQPMRALLFLVVVVQFSAAAAAILAANSRRYVEAFAWFVLAYLIPQGADANLYAAVLLAAGASLAAWAGACKFRWSAPALLSVAMAGFLLLPILGGVTPHPRLHTPDLAQLSVWARASTPVDAVFLFADAGKQLQPGIFRSEALRAVYVDWKGGGQINYLPDLGVEWWKRWQQTMAAPFDPRGFARYRPLGIDYIVLTPRNRLPGRAPVFENAAYLVYAS